MTAQSNQCRLLAGGAPFKAQTSVIPVGNATLDDDNTLSADRPIMDCPVQQTPVKNGAPANIELFKKLIRCRKGEKAARKGVDGAVTVEVLEVLIFLRDVRSRVYFEQMKGRGTRVLSSTDLQSVSGEDARAKTRFIIVDAVGVCESDKTESRSTASPACR